MKKVSSGRSAIVMFFGRGLGAGAALLFVIVVPRVLGPSNYGYYSFWFAQLFLLFTIFDLGAVDLIRRYLPNLLAIESGEAKTLVLKVTALKALLIPMALFLLPVYQERWVFVAILISSVAAAFSFILSEVNFAGSRMIWYSVYHIFRKLLRFALLICLFVLFKRNGIIAALLSTEFIVLILFIIVTRSVFPKTAAQPLSRPVANYLGYGILLYLSTLLFLATGRLPVVLARLSGLTFEEVGYLALVVDIFYFALRELFYGISESLLPIQAVYHEQGQRERLPQSFHSVIKYSLLLLIPCMGILAAYPVEVLTLIGRQYLPALPLFILFIPVVALNVLAFINRQILIIFEQKWWIFGINAISFSVFLIPALTIRPLTLSALATYILAASAVNCGMMWVISRRVMVIPGEGALYLKFLLATLILTVPLFQGHALGFPVRVLLTFIGVTVYFVVLNLFGVFSLEDIKRILQFTERKIP